MNRSFLLIPENLTYRILHTGLHAGSLHMKFTGCIRLTGIQHADPERTTVLLILGRVLTQVKFGLAINVYISIYVCMHMWKTSKLRQTMYSRSHWLFI